MSGPAGGRWLTVCIVGIAGCGSVEQKPVDAGLDAAVDAAIDVPLDTVPAVRFEVAYVNEITLTPSFSTVFSFVAVVNSGATALQTSGASVVSYTDDNPGIDWTFAKEAEATKELAPGLAAGALSPAARMRIVDSGLMTEQIDDPFLNFAMRFPQPPPIGLTLNAQAVIQIAGKEVMLPFVIHVVETGDLTLSSARRTSSQP